MPQPPNRDAAAETTGGCCQGTCPAVAVRPPAVHSFSRPFARLHGITEAIIAGYLANRIMASIGCDDEDADYRISLDALTKKYPYLSRSGIAGALARLKRKGVLVTHQNNVRGFDRTTHYRFAPESFTVASRDPVYFDVAMAQQFGVPTALVLTNLRMRIAEVRFQAPEATHYRFSARNVVKYLPLSKNTLGRALKTLRDAGRVQLVEGRGWDRATQVDIAHFLTHDAIANMAAPETNSDSPTVDTHEPGADNHAPEAHNDNILEGVLGRSALEGESEEKDTYETRPAPPFAGRACSLPSSPRPASTSLGSSGTIIGASAPDVAAESGAVNGSSTVALAVPASATTAGGRDGVSGVFPFKTLMVAGRRAAVSEVGPIHHLDGVQAMRSYLPPTEAPAHGAVPRYHHDTTGKPTYFTQFADLQQENRRRSNGNATQWQRLNSAVLTRALAMFTAWGPAKLLRALAQTTNQERYEVCRGWIAAFKCPETDLDIYGNIDQVPNLLTELFVLGCEAYLNPDLEQCEPQILKMAEMIFQVVPPYLDGDRAALERLGLSRLRYGELVRQERHCSPDEAKEADGRLSAAEKVKVLENAMLSRNRVGRWTLKGERRHDLFAWNVKALKAAEDFFTDHQHWAAGDLLSIMDLAVETQLSGLGVGGYGDQFYAEKANDLDFLMTHFERIMGSETIRGMRLPTPRFRPLQPTPVEKGQP